MCRRAALDIGADIVHGSWLLGQLLDVEMNLTVATDTWWTSLGAPFVEVLRTSSASRLNCNNLVKLGLCMADLLELLAPVLRLFCPNISGPAFGQGA